MDNVRKADALVNFLRRKYRVKQTLNGGKIVVCTTAKHFVRTAVRMLKADLTLRRIAVRKLEAEYERSDLKNVESTPIDAA